MELSYRTVVPEDLPLLHRWYNDPACHGEYDEGSECALDRLQEKYDRTRFDGGGGWTRMIVLDGRVVGWFDWSLHPWDDWVAMLGVILAEVEVRGRGVGTAVHRLAVRHIFETRPEVEKIEGVTDAEHRAERRVLEKAGFSLEGVLRSRNRLRGVLRDMASYGLLRSEWEAQT